MSTLKQESIWKTFETKKQWTTFWNALLARQGIIAYLPIIAINILIFYFTSWQSLWLNTDPARYQCYALTYWMGSSGVHLLPATQCSFLQISAIPQPPLHMLPLEYPPFTLVIFSLPLIAPLAYYQLFFAVLMALVSTFIYWLLLHYGPRGSALIFVLYILLGVLALVQERFDLVPAALTLICLIAAEHKRWSLAYCALALGFLIKIYPIIFLPPLFIAEQLYKGAFNIPGTPSSPKSLSHDLWLALRSLKHWHWKNTVLFFSMIIGITGFFAIFNAHGAILSQLSYFADRPLQVEAIGSVLLWLGTNFGFPVHILYSFGSINMLSELGGVVSIAFEVFFIAGYLYTIYLQWRGKIDVVQSCIAVLFIFIATGKVFSPQYLIWIIPLLAYSGAFNLLWLVIWGSISLLTTVIYPYLYTRTLEPVNIPFVPGFTLVVTARNTLFVLLTLAYLFNWFHIRKRLDIPLYKVQLDQQKQ